MKGEKTTRAGRVPFFRWASPPEGVATSQSLHHSQAARHPLPIGRKTSGNLACRRGRRIKIEQRIQVVLIHAGTQR